jgi:hypothetical protein
MPYYSIVTFGAPAKTLPSFVRSPNRALKLARAALGTGTCSAVRIYACDTVALAKSADISDVRAGERIELAL